MGKKNKYQQHARRRELLAGLSPTPAEAKKNVKASGIATARDLLIGAIGGGLAGAVAGRSSLLLGIAVTGAGHYMGQGMMTAFGIGMMSSGSYQNMAGLRGLEGVDGVKERVKAFSEDVKKRLFLDKVIKSKKRSDEDVNGMGEVEYYNYPELQGSEEDNLQEIERQIAAASQAGVGEVQEDRVFGMDELIERNL
jgi:hypothetical protein